MGVRGRKSGMDLALATTARIEAVERQKPPHDLTDEETEVFVGIVNNEPADWFSPATVPLLAQYCRHVVRAREIAAMLAQSEGGRTIYEYDLLLRMQSRETLTMTTVGTKLRITQQSTINARGNKRHQAARMPWDPIPAKV